MGDGEELESDMGQDRIEGVHAIVEGSSRAREGVPGDCEMSTWWTMAGSRPDATDAGSVGDQDCRHVVEGKRPMDAIVIGIWGE